jgi:ectoine hydroxylase-related dioxygenase (phytanoyl-CoA dioxygenase family)
MTTAYSTKNQHFQQEEKQFFNNNGYIIVPNLFNDDDMQWIERYITEIENWPEQQGRTMKYFEENQPQNTPKLLNRIENFLPFHPQLNELINGERTIGYVSELLNEPAVLFKDKINFKKPGGSDFKPHQDIQAGWEKYASYFISIAIAVDETNIENGCLEIAQGNYQARQIGQLWKPLTEEELSGNTFVHVPQKPGDAIFFNGYVAHQSGPNRTDRPRRNIYLTYNRASERPHSNQYYADKRKSYPPDAERSASGHYQYRV